MVRMSSHLDHEGEVLMPKSQQKKQRKLDKFLAKKQHRTEQRKALKLRRRLRKAAEDSQQQENGFNGDCGKGKNVTPPGRRRCLNDDEFEAAVSAESPQIVVDCDFEDLQTSRELTSLSQQIMQSYGCNRRSGSPCRLKLYGVGSKLRLVLGQLSGIDNWRGFEMTDTLIGDASDLPSMYYLTADSDQCMEDLELGKIYVIGGLVDRNRHKNLTSNKAKELGIQTIRLPIPEFCKLTGSKVLTVNQGNYSTSSRRVKLFSSHEAIYRFCPFSTCTVFDILMKRHQNVSWPETFSMAIPSRKSAPIAAISQPSQKIVNSDHEQLETSTMRSDE